MDQPNVSEKGGNAASRGRITPPLKWHIDGGKHYLARRLVALLPPHTHYVEPFAGGLAVLLAKDPGGVSEVANDLDGRLTNFWRCLQLPETFAEFRRAAEAVPFSEREFRAAAAKLARPCNATGVCLGCGLAFFVVARQSLAGRRTAFAPLSRTRTRRGMNEQASAWLGAVDGLPAVHERLRRVVVLNRDAIDVIRSQDGPETLFYLDPPYLAETRADRDTYAHELTAGQHHELLCVARECRGKVMLSGYRSAMYDDLLKGWRRVDFNVPNNAAGGVTKRRMVECVWCNFPAPHAAE